MKFTKREAVLLVILFVLAVFFIEYKFVVVPGLARYNELVEKDQSVQAKVDEINMMIKSTPSIQANKTKLLSEIETVVEPFFGQLNPDALLWTSNDLMTQSGLLFKNYAIQGINKTTVKGYQSQIVELTYKIKTLVSDYANAAKSIDQEASQKEPDNQEKSDSLTSDVENFSLRTNLSGTYEQLKDFVTYIETLDKTVVVSTLDMKNSESSGILDINMLITFFGIEKIKDDADINNTWNQPDYESPKQNPFNVQTVPSISPVPSPTPIP